MRFFFSFFRILFEKSRSLQVFENKKQINNHVLIFEAQRDVNMIWNWTQKIAILQTEATQHSTLNRHSKQKKKADQ